ncbi:MAG: 30S ribosomal protein S4 [Candidatus Aenigmatarchaeota archaeon]
MGDPKKQRKKYEKPLIPWDERRIENDKDIMKNYGLKRKEEILKMESFLRKLRRRARDAAAGSSEKERNELLQRCRNIGLIGEDDDVGQILRIELKDVLERRLQTLVAKIDGVRSPGHARQLLTHGHVKVDEKVMTSSSFFVPKDLEDKISVDKKALVMDE